MYFRANPFTMYRETKVFLKSFKWDKGRKCNKFGTQIMMYFISFSEDAGSSIQDRFQMFFKEISKDTTAVINSTKDKRTVVLQALRFSLVDGSFFMCLCVWD